VDNLCFDKRFLVSLTLDFDEKCHFLYFSTIMITGLGFGLEDTGLGLGLVLGLEENWPWPQNSKTTGLGLEHAVLEPIPAKK